MLVIVLSYKLRSERLESPANAPVATLVIALLFNSRELRLESPVSEGTAQARLLSDKYNHATCPASQETPYQVSQMVVESHQSVVSVQLSPFVELYKLTKFSHSV